MSSDRNTQLIGVSGSDVFQADHSGGRGGPLRHRVALGERAGRRRGYTEHMVRRWLHTPIALSLVLALVVGNVMAVQGLRCLMPSCTMCEPKVAKEPQGCCPEKDPAPKTCSCMASGDSHPDGVLGARADVPATSWISVLPEPIVLVAREPETLRPPEASAPGPPGNDFHRAPCGRAPPAS